MDMKTVEKNYYISKIAKKLCAVPKNVNNMLKISRTFICW